MSIRTVLVAGAGQMGSGIAQVAAQAGLAVRLFDLSDALVEKGLSVLQQNLQRDVDKQRRTAAERDEIQSRIQVTTNLNLAATVDMVIEAVVENLSVKIDLLRRLDEICPAHAILASNTSSLPITQLAAATRRPGQVIGMHFMNPVPVMKLVEIIRGAATTDATYQAVHQLAAEMGKTPALVHDFPGFVANRILMPLLNEAMFCFYEGIASVQSIDTVMKLGMNHPMGPLQLADFIGLDTCLSVMNVMYEGFKDPKYRPCPLLVQYVQAGYLGRKSGRGFYVWGADGQMTPVERAGV